MENRFAVRPKRKWSGPEANHLYRRAGFGANAAELELSLREGLDKTLDRLFKGPGHDPALESGIDYLVASGNVESLQAWWISLMLAGTAPLHERIVLMWHDHFATSNDKVDDVRMMLRQNRIFREQGLGDFRKLLHAVAKDPAMLVWLDGNKNKRGNPNENFAREVMELFGLGIGNYSEIDIQEVARAFTGWGTKGRSFAYRQGDHDPGTKTFLGKQGAFDGDQAIDVILAQPACARHIARRLLQEFVTELPEDQDVQTMAKMLTDADWNVGECLRQLFKSEFFHREEFRGNRISSPVEFAISSCRALELRPSPTEVAQALGKMGHSLFRPPSVKGWDGGRAWINASTWLARHNCAAQLASRTDQGVLFHAARKNKAAQSMKLLLEHLMPDGVTDEFRSVLLAECERASDPQEIGRGLATLILTSPEYHLV